MFKFPNFLSRVSKPKNILNAPILLKNHSFLSNSYSSSSPSHQAGKKTRQLSIGIIHAKAIKDGTVLHLPISNHLLSLYVKSSLLVHARQVFDETPNRDVRSWTILISGFSRIGSNDVALHLFTQMQKEGTCPNLFTFSSILKCCSGVRGVRVGQSIHGWILRNEVDIDITLENSFLDFYVKCGSFHYAKRLFGKMRDKDTVSWNIMIGACLRNGDMDNARDLFEWLPVKDAASWNTIIDGHLQNGCGKHALELLYRMVNVGPAFTEVTFSIALALASSLTILELGRQVHVPVLRSGLLDDAFVRNSLIDMYCKCGQLEKASLIFHDFPRVLTRYSEATRAESEAESVLRSSIITGYVQNGRVEDALELFRSLIHEQVDVDKFTLTSMLSACANAGLLEFGQLIHAYILKTGKEPDEFLGASMIDMYAKCGRLDDTWSIFLRAKVRNIVLWTALISGYALHGQGREAIRVFELMIKEGIKPNEVTFVGVLTGCSHAGLVDEGCNYFRLMKEAYDIKPRVEHYTCMVDLFGRAGRLDEAEDFIKKNDIAHLSTVWRAFLSSCLVHKNVEMGRRVSDKLIELEPLAAGPYVQFSNAYASDHRWDEAATLRGLMQEKGVKKQPAQSWI